VREYAARVNAFPTGPQYNYPIQATTPGGCNTQVVADPTSNSFMAVARKQCWENNLELGCYKLCVSQAERILGRSRVAIEYPAATRRLTQIEDYPSECNYVAEGKFYGIRGERECRTLTLECAVLNGGLKRATYCREQCKFNVYKRCQSIETQRSPFVPVENWAMYLRTERALPVLKDVGYLYRAN